MRKILLLTILCLSALPSLADECRAELTRRNGTVIETFYEYSSYLTRACKRAVDRCYDELYYRQSNGRNPYAYCREKRIYSNHKRSCTIYLKNGRGYTVRQYTRYAYDYSDACRRARNACEVDRGYGSRRGYCSGVYSSGPIYRPTPPRPRRPRPAPTPKRPRRR